MPFQFCNWYLNPVVKPASINHKNITGRTNIARVPLLSSKNLKFSLHVRKNSISRNEVDEIGWWWPTDFYEVLAEAEITGDHLKREREFTSHNLPGKHVRCLHKNNDEVYHTCNAQQFSTEIFWVLCPWYSVLFTREWGLTAGFTATPKWWYPSHCNSTNGHLFQ